ncbi:MAG: protoheme IX farnesyltransferase [Deltaproteobacteria bacterium]|nr:protoheme IX farnesyltransferase [Deltaproteobacteria bacterium]
MSGAVGSSSREDFSPLAIPPEDATEAAVSAPAAAPRPLPRALATARDLLALTKPGVTLMCVATASAGLWVAPLRPGVGTIIGTLLGTALAVAAAAAFNMFLERDLDRRMQRTRRRPLPDGRLAPGAAVALGSVLAVAATVLLWTQVNRLTALLALIALLSYVLVYTPLKRQTHLALWVGAIPGAMPPLMGWTAATGRLDLAGWALFLTVALWQLPHFLAISIYRRAEYTRAGIKIVPEELGETVARAQCVIFTAALLPASLSLPALGVAGWIYTAAALPAGLGWLLLALAGLRAPSGPTWARRFFLASLVYLPVIVLGLMLDAVFR